MTIACIYLDLDGVLVDFVGAALSLYGVEEIDGKPARECVRAWDGMPATLSRALGHSVTAEDLWTRVAEAGPNLWHELEWLPWGRDLFALCESYGPTVLMSTPTLTPYVAAGKLMWIHDHMPSGWQARWALTPCKHHMAHPGALLVDDADHNFEKFSAHGGNAFKWPQTWNTRRDEADADPLRANALQELEAYLKALS